MTRRHLLHSIKLAFPSTRRKWLFDEMFFYPQDDERLEVFEAVNGMDWKEIASSDVITASAVIPSSASPEFFSFVLPAFLIIAIERNWIDLVDQVDFALDSTKSPLADAYKSVLTNDQLKTIEEVAEFLQNV